VTTFLARAPVDDGRPRIFCFHHAGGAASAFSAWPALVSDQARVHPVQLPGREWRISQPRFRSFPAMIDALADSLGPHLRPPYFLYGHSMGGLIGYALTRRMLEGGRPGPQALVVGACPAPHLPAPMSDLYAAAETSDMRLAKALTAIGGLPAALLNEPDWLRLLMPIVRDDLILCSSFERVLSEPLPCPIRALAGADDPLVAPQQIHAWHQQTTAQFDFQILPTGHFFAADAAQAVIEALVDWPDPALPHRSRRPDETTKSPHQPRRDDARNQS
jgi:surfactin synthase thioesterase subunit